MSDESMIGSELGRELKAIRLEMERAYTDQSRLNYDWLARCISVVSRAEQALKRHGIDLTEVSGMSNDQKQDVIILKVKKMKLTRSESGVWMVKDDQTAAMLLAKHIVEQMDGKLPVEEHVLGLVIAPVVNQLLDAAAGTTLPGSDASKLPILKEDPTGEAIQKAAEECAEHVLVGQGARTFARIMEKHLREPCAPHEATH